MTDFLTNDPRFYAARKTDQSGGRGWDLRPDPRFAAVPNHDFRETGWARKYAVAAFWLGIAIGLFIAGLVVL